MKKVIGFLPAIGALGVWSAPSVCAAVTDAGESGINTDGITAAVIAICAVLAAAIVATAVFLAKKNMKNR